MFLRTEQAFGPDPPAFTRNRTDIGLPAPASPRVVVVGGSGHARVVIDILENESRYRIVGLVDAFKPVHSKAFGYQILGREDDLPRLVAAGVCDAVIVAVGDNWVRAQISKRLQNLVPELHFATAIHPFSQIARDVSIGPGTIIMPGAVVNAGSRIGEGCILNTSCSLDHDSVMGDFCSLAPRTVTGGAVKIGAFSAVCIGAVISHAVSIGKHSVIGAGATVVKDVPDGVVAFGVPARVIRRRNPQDSYLGERSYEVPKSRISTAAPAGISSWCSTRLISSESQDWNSYIERTPHDFFHRAEYHRVCEISGQGQAWLTLYGTLDKFVAWPIMLQDVQSDKSDSSSRFRDITSAYGYTGPTTCGCEHDRAFLRAAWTSMREVWRSLGVISAFTRFHPLLENHRHLPYLRDNPQQPEFAAQDCSDGATIAIDLTRPPEETWQCYARQHRQSLRRLDNLGMRADSDLQWTHLNDFLNLYHSTMRRNRALPFYFFDKHYFCRLRDALGSHGSLMLVRDADEIVAAALLIEYGGTVHVHLLATADSAVALSPSKLVIHATQAWARERGNRLVHLGGGRGSRTDDPLFRFKSGFSDRRYAFYTGRWIIDGEKYERLSSMSSHLLTDNQPQATFFPAYRAPLQAHLKY